MSRGVSTADLMRSFDSELSESERRTVARQVSLSKRLQDELVVLETVRSEPPASARQRTTKGLR